MGPEGQEKSPEERTLEKDQSNINSARHEANLIAGATRAA